MNCILYGFYVTLVSLIRLYKWLEFQLIKPFTPLLKRKAKQYAENIGVVFHCPGDKWTEEDNERVLSKCEKYDHLVHLKVKDDSYFSRMANLGTLASGETYMDGIWEYTKDERDVVEWVKRVAENNLLELYWHPWNRFLEWVELQAFNLQTSGRAFQVGKEHYDLGNDLYQLMLDPWMQYTCGYWARADNLNKAQEDKLELIAKKLDLKPGMRVLDIGCGFGMLCKYLAEKHGVHCVGVTISEEQAAYGRKANEGLPVEIRLQDYREVNEEFDRVVSIGCMEHIGTKNYGTFMKVARRCLKDDGIFLLHTIGMNHKNMPKTEKWLHKYIFPNGQLPRPEEIANAANGLFILEDWHNFGPDYAKTLEAWRYNFNLNWDKLKDKYDERFYRMWIFYLCCCEGIFLSRRTHLYQVVFSKDGLQTGYRAAR